MSLFMQSDQPTLNLEIIVNNVREAREQLLELEGLISREELDETELRIGLHHALHHLNFAWNIRHQTSERYASLTTEDFEEWCRHPEELDSPL
jgi:uncharacterized ferritin-like protein (DUF455 family)